MVDGFFPTALKRRRKRIRAEAVRQDAQNYRAGNRQNQLLSIRQMMVQDDHGQHDVGKTSRAEPPEEQFAARFQAHPCSR